MKKIFSILIICLISLSIYAVPAKPGPRVLQQPDGTEITVYAHGDEFHHFYTDKEGRLLSKDSQGKWVIANEQAVSAHKAKAKQGQDKRLVRQAKQEINLAPRGLVILVGYSDKPFTRTRQEFDDMLNKKGYNVNGTPGSANDYFMQQSFGKYNPQFDIVGPYTVSHTSSYYAGSEGDGTENVGQLIVDACKLADQDGTDFTKYDNDGDGKVDFVFVVFSGYGLADYAESFDKDSIACVWPHMFYVSGYDGITSSKRTFDGKKVDRYACTNELTRLGAKYNKLTQTFFGGTEAMCGVATFCHEFSHVCGLPDFYDTDQDRVMYGTTYQTLGEWDLMDAGTYNNDGFTPPAYSAYERFYCGWITPTILSTEQECYELENLNTNGQAYLISSTGKHNLDGESPSPTTFYLLENRQQVKGSFDEHLPGHGMLLTKVKYSASDWRNNSPNNYKRGQQGVELIEADDERSDYGDDGDTYPGKSTVTSKQVITGYKLNNITEKNGLISFRMNRTTACEDEPVTPPTPEKKDTMTVTEAVSYISALTYTTPSTDSVYVKGIISEIVQVLTTGNFCNARFYIKDEKSSLYCYDIYNLGNTKFTSENQIQVGDTVIIYGPVQNYMGTTPEMARGGYITYLGRPQSEQPQTGDYTYEPTEVTTINFEAEDVFVDNSTEGQLLVYLITDEGELDLLFLTDSQDLPSGTFEINNSGNNNTVVASQGWDGTKDQPTVFLTEFNEDKQYAACYYLMSGTVTITNTDDYLQITISAVTYNGSTFNATYLDGEVPTSLDATDNTAFVRKTETGIEINAAHENVKIYNALGQIIYNATVNGKTAITLPKQQVYVVRLQNKSIKIIL